MGRTCNENKRRGKGVLTVQGEGKRKIGWGSKCCKGVFCCVVAFLLFQRFSMFFFFGLSVRCKAEKKGEFGPTIMWNSLHLW